MKQLHDMVRFHCLISFRLDERRRIKESIKILFKKEKRSLGSLDYIFCTEDYLLKINQQYLHHSTDTDIITFDLSDTSEVVIGEIYISVPRVKKNAVIYNVSFQEEIKRVMFHGALHLCGFKDKQKKDISIMRAKEAHYLKIF